MYGESVTQFYVQNLPFRKAYTLYDDALWPDHTLLGLP